MSSKHDGRPSGAEQESSVETSMIQCDNCGDPIDRADWYPVRLVETGSNDRLVSFCDEACLEEWEEDST